MMPRLLTLVLALWSTSALAHDARTAAIEVDVVGSLVTVHLAVTQAGLHQALEAAAGHALDATGADYRVLVADHLRQTLRLSADGHPLAVGDIGLRLGDHQSDARFVVDLPDGARELAVTVGSFGGVEGQQTVVRIRHGGETTRGVLSDADGWTASVRLTLPEPPVAAASGARWAAGLGVVGLLAGLLLLSARRTPSA